MRKIALVLAVIITTLPLPVFSSDVEFIVIPSLCGQQQPVLCIDYQYLYQHYKPFQKYMPMKADWVVMPSDMQKYRGWLVENVGYLMHKYQSAYTYVRDPYTPQTDTDTAQYIKTHQVIDITNELLQNLQQDKGQAAYYYLQRGPNIYLLFPDFTNEWPLHLQH